MITIQRYFKTNPMPDWENIWAYHENRLKRVGLTGYEVGKNIENYNGQNMVIYGDFNHFDRICLRKNGVDQF